MDFIKMISSNKGSIAIPIAILVTVLLIGGAILSRNLGAGNTNTSPTLSGGHGGGTASNSRPNSGFRPVSENDHIRGNPDAKISIVEYSDFECPFCARLHPTLGRIVDEFGDDVNWVYRHFPLTSIHSRARAAAIASECVANLGGNDAFWSFADTLFVNQRSLGSKFYESTAVNLGIDRDEFTQCTKDRNIANEVSADNNEAIGNGGRGTPFSILVRADGRLFPFSGALPYEQIRAFVEEEIANSL